MVMGLVRRMAADQTREQDQAALTAAARRGSADAVYRPHAGPVLPIAYRLLQSRADAEDVVHDVFVGLPELLRKYEERGALAAWLKTVTARVALARLPELSRQSHEDPDQFARAARTSTPPSRSKPRCARCRPRSAPCSCSRKSKDSRTPKSRGCSTSRPARRKCGCIAPCSSCGRCSEPEINHERAGLSRGHPPRARRDRKSTS